jgi:ketosteroid isomerase-like protein
MENDTAALCSEAYETYSRGDFEALLGFFDPAIEVYVAPPNFESGTYRGHAEYLRLIERWGAAWEEMRTEPRGTEVAGE